VHVFSPNNILFLQWSDSGQKFSKRRHFFAPDQATGIVSAGINDICERLTVEAFPLSLLQRGVAL